MVCKLNIVKKLILLLVLVPILSFSQEKEIDFDSVERPPIYPGCEPYTQQLRSCTQRKIQTHINKNFRYPEFAQKTGIQGRVFVYFIIDKDGSVVGIKTRGPHPILEIEAKRIISILPKFIPGYVDGKAVRVPFSMPITFKLQK